MWLHTSGCSHSFQIDSTWTQKGLQLGFSLDSAPRSSHTDSQISGMYLSFSLFIARYSFFVKPYLADLLVWLAKSALIFLSIISFKTLILSSTCREFWSTLFCYVHQWYVLGVITVFIVAVTDASTQEDLSEFNAGKNHSFCRLVFAGISAFYPGQFLLYW